MKGSEKEGTISDGVSREKSEVLVFTLSRLFLPGECHFIVQAAL